MKLTIILLFISSVVYAQEYAEVTTVKIGVSGIDKVDYYFSSQDSITIYKRYKLIHVLDAVKLMESKGWELVTINNTTSGNLFITVAYLKYGHKKSN